MSSPDIATTAEDRKEPSGQPGTKLERLPVHIFEDSSTLSRHVAQRVADLIARGREEGRNVVLGLPTGSTPIGVYQHLARMHREEGLDLSNVVTFNVDEYYPMEPDGLQSYHRFMEENFFQFVNIRRENINIPRGDIPYEEVESHCRAYEQAIADAGGIDLILLGIGRSGHVGFNEPGSSKDTRTRIITLDEITRKDAASDFFQEEFVPREAITMGVGTILDAREIILMATGEHKARIVKRAVEEEPSRKVSASYLQLHPNASFFVDRAAGSELTREKTPWLVMDIEWDRNMSKRAVIWLSEKVNKAILRLEKSDFYREHLYTLLNAYPNVDDLCRMVFEDLRRRVLYKDQLMKNKKVILFSPHPDDDVISMGGMLDKLVANGNDVTVAYMTNGSVAVFDADVRRSLRFVEFSYDVLGVDEKTKAEIRERKARIEKFLDEKGPGQIDLQEVQQLKAFIRYAEAVAGIEVLGLGEENARFLDMPFYKTGMVKKDPIGEGDIKVVLDLMNEIKPDHIFVAGDLSDPHGTHQMCYVAIREALKRYNEGRPVAATNGNQAPVDQEGGGILIPDTSEQPLVWLYRGAWQEWEVYRAHVFLPMSKADLDRKIEAIFKHESQKDRALFPGAYDEREFWQRARDRNMGLAESLNRHGLPEFYACEAYVTTYTMN
jgi:glucosamine-6-phosphate deaminase